MGKKKKGIPVLQKEQAVRQQELLEKKRKARAEFNVSTGPANLSERKQELEMKLREKKDEKDQIRREKKKEKEHDRFQNDYHASVAFDQVEGVSVSQWFLSICWIQIPVLGFIYALVLILHPRTHASKKNFAIGYLIYRILVLLLAATVLYVLYEVGLDLVDQVLSYVK